MWQDITEKEKAEFNALASHPLQSFEWGEFRKKTGVKVIRKGLFEKSKLKSAFQMTIHKIPHTRYAIGYIPKGTMPTQAMTSELQRIGKEEKCIFIQLEPNIEKGSQFQPKADHPLDDIVHSSQLGLRPSAHPLFTKYTFVLDLTGSEEELLKDMHPKTRYNIRVAQKHNVKVKEDSSEKAFESYLTLMRETTNRQGFFAHTPRYHRMMWETLRPLVIPTKRKRVEGSRSTEVSEKDSSTSLRFARNDRLTAHLLVASYNNIPLTTWILFVFHDTLYYPYGASSNLHREAMASNLQMWDAIKFGKKLGLKSFDMWGSLGESPNPKDPWFGFHRFKQGYGPKLVEYIGSYDVIINPTLYQIYKVADKLRGMYLSLKR